VTRKRLHRVGYNAAAVLVLLVTVFPIYWMVATGFKRGPDILSFEPKWLPIPGTLENYRSAVAKPYFLQDVGNSLVVVVATVLIALALAFLAALAAGRFRFRGRAAMIVMLIVVQMVPLEALIIPIYLSLDRVGQTDKLAGISRSASGPCVASSSTSPRSSRRRRWSTAAPAPGRSGASCSPWSRRGWSRPRCSPSSSSGTTT
jgi:ABC-type glycerol-3-phosphate transport system permease component